MNTRQIVTFIVEGERYGIGVGAVREVLEVSRITKLPGGTPDMLGVIDVRGAAVPVFDMGRKLNGRPAGLSGSSAVLVLETGSGDSPAAAGLLVDAVLDVVEQDEAGIERAALGLSSRGPGFVEGIGKGLDGFTILLDAEGLLAGELPRPGSSPLESGLAS